MICRESPCTITLVLGSSWRTSLSCCREWQDSQPEITHALGATWKEKVSAAPSFWTCSVSSIYSCATLTSWKRKGVIYMHAVLKETFQTTFLGMCAVGCILLGRRALHTRFSFLRVKVEKDKWTFKNLQMHQPVAPIRSEFMGWPNWRTQTLPVTLMQIPRKYNFGGPLIIQRKASTSLVNVLGEFEDSRCLLSPLPVHSKNPGCWQFLENCGLFLSKNPEVYNYMSFHCLYKQHCERWLPVSNGIL